MGSASSEEGYLISLHLPEDNQASHIYVVGSTRFGKLKALASLVIE